MNGHRTLPAETGNHWKPLQQLNAHASSQVLPTPGEADCPYSQLQPSSKDIISDIFRKNPIKEKLDVCCKTKKSRFSVHTVFC